MKTILIFGGGFVGGHIAALACSRAYRVVVADSSFRAGLGGVDWRTVDIGERSQVRALVEEIGPDAVVNVAAIADVDLAERERDLAWKVNVEGARSIAEASASRGAACVFFSSDAVFDGLRSSYAEDDPTAPRNYYGQTKAAAEKAVIAAYPGVAVIRISLVLGFPVTGGNSFFAALEAKLASGARVPCPTDEVRTPIDVLTLAESVLELSENGFSGLLHLGATTSIDRCSLTRKTAALLGFGEDQVLATPTQEDAAGRAPRHKIGIIDVGKARRTLKTPMLGIDETVARALSTRAKKGG
jgi:dTDP-4-dehydrorhamnose reductase